MDYYDDEKKQLSIVEELQDRHQQLVSQRFQFRPHVHSNVIVEEFKEEQEGENEQFMEQEEQLEEQEENLFRSGPEQIYERYTAENAEDWEIDPLDNDKDQLILDPDQVGAEEEDLKEHLEQIQLPNRKYPRQVANEWEEEVRPAPRDRPYGPEGGPLWYYYWARRDKGWCFMCVHGRNVQTADKFPEYFKINQMVEEFWGTCPIKLIAQQIQRKFIENIQKRLPPRQIDPIVQKPLPPHWWWQANIIAHWTTHQSSPTILKEMSLRTIITIERTLEKRVRRKHKVTGQTMIDSKILRDLFLTQNQRIKIEDNISKTRTRLVSGGI